ncbi:MAG: hypothetical protein QF824_04215 [Candidatus Woesearchaeota archaeon]|jgi:plastocyanin|nr:hypothetical protein [Candidatus Woesearchaeota archaeon]
MRLFPLFLVLILIIGCIGTPTGRSIITIQDVDASGNVIQLEETIQAEPEEPTEPEEPEEIVIEEPEEEPEEPEELINESATNVIEIIDKTFVPETITVPVGTTVIWKHIDEKAQEEKRQHLIRIYPLGNKSQYMDYGDEFEFTFTEAKRYWYIDILYSKVMKRGFVVVEE